MSNNGADAVFVEVIASVSEALSLFGYKRSGQLLRRLIGENAAIIEFQKSRDSNREKVIFTINLAIVCGRLLDPGRTIVNKAKSMDGHFRMRIGELLPGNNDLWWDVVPDSDGRALADVVSNTLVEHAVPTLEAYVGSRKLLELWKSGSSPGITEVQRLRLISELEAVI